MQVTTDAGVDDWIPTLTTTHEGDLLLFFASTKRKPEAGSELYVTRKKKGASDWDMPNAATVNDALEHDYRFFERTQN